MGFLTVLPGFLAVLLLAVSTTAAPFKCGDELVVTRKYFMDKNIKYTSQHDIVSLLVPLNRMNFGDDDDSDEEESNGVVMFFVEADVNDKKDKEYKGLYVYKEEKATKILANGRDAAALHDGNKQVYLGAADGIYIYEGSNGTTQKYGTIDESIIQIEADNQTGTFYFLTEDYELFSIADEGTRQNKVEDIKDAREFAIDYVSNIYYYDSSNQLYVLNPDGVQKFEGLPTAKAVKLVRPMFEQDEGVFAIIDKSLYLLYQNGTALKTKVSFEVKPTAYAPDATLLQYYALEKKIYEFNVIELLLSEFDELKAFLDDKKNDIQSIATKSRSAFGAD